ncbi:MAG TPA: DUF4173 domain-containing protein [Candidatus Limnocylindria bacterium]|nr:DUF4173 domain-containing protein [Candidatus Limnocylindria bacterium]
MPPRRAAILVLAAAAFGLVFQYLFVRERTGANVVAATALFLALTWAFRDRGRHFAWRDAWLPLGALLFAALCAIRTDALLVAFDALASVALALGTVVASRGVPVSDLPLGRLIATGLAACGALLSRMVMACAVAIPALGAFAPGRASRMVGYGGGVVLAVPFLVVFAVLFSSADAVFQRTLADALDFVRWRELLADAPWRATLATVAMWLAGGALAWLAEPPSTDRDTRPAGLVGADPVTAMLVAIDALFAFFVVVQIAYLFGGRDTVAAAGIAYSAYARRGFFELVAVATLVGGLLFSVDLVVRERGRAYRTAAILLVALTAVVLASAALRMALYQQAYGWTELRLYACAATLYLALALAVLAWAVARSRMEVALQRLVLAGIVVAIATNAVGPSDLIARANIERATSPALPADVSRDLDVCYLVSLGDGAVPAIMRALPSLPDGERTRTLELLRADATRRPGPGGWQSWNLDRRRAEEVLPR